MFIGFIIQCAFVRRWVVAIFVKQFVAFLNDDGSPVTGENGPALTHNESTTPSKHKMKARQAFLLIPFDIFTGNLSRKTAACSVAQCLSPPLLLQFQ